MYWAFKASYSNKGQITSVNRPRPKRGKCLNILLWFQLNWFVVAYHYAVTPCPSPLYLDLGVELNNKSYLKLPPLIFRPFSVLQDIVGEVNWTNSQSWRSRLLHNYIFHFVFITVSHIKCFNLLYLQNLKRDTNKIRLCVSLT